MNDDDLRRALRRGGPFDTTKLRLRCTHCGHEAMESLRWFHEKQMLCPLCDGAFDDKIMRELGQLLAHQVVRKAKGGDGIPGLDHDGKFSN